MKKLLASAIEKLIATLQANRITLIVWGVIVLVIVGCVAANRANKADIRAKLTSPDAAARQAEVLKLASSRSLADALTDTQDPNTPATSPANVASNQLRETAAATLDTLVKADQLPADVAMDNLFLLRKDSDAAVKASATDALAALGKKSDANLKSLVARLSDGDPDVRSAAADSLGMIGGAKAASLIAPLVKNPAAADAAGSALTKIGKSSVPFLTPMLSDKDTALRVQIVNTLAAIGDASAIPALTQQVAAQPPFPTVRRLAIIALAGIVLKTIPPPVAATAPPTAKPTAKIPAGPSPDDIALAKSTVGVFMATLDNTAADSFARSRSALALGRLSGSQSAGSLIKALGDYDVRVARAALTGIQQVGPSAVPALSAASQSRTEAIRVAAASALGGIGDSTALAAIHAGLADPSANVRAAAASALGASGNKDSIPLLIALLGDPSGQVAGEASNSLHLLGKPAIAPLVAALGSPNPSAAFYASQALRQIGDAAVPEVSTALASGSSDQVKVWSAVTLGQIRDGSARPALTAAAETGTPRARWAASQALQELGQA